MWLKLGAAVVVLLVCAPAAQADGDQRELRTYAHGTWASFVAMTDERSGLPADILNADGTTSVQTSTTNIGAYMWSAVAAEELGIIRRRELVARLSKTLSYARADGALRADRPVLQLVRPPHGREADGLAADRRTAEPDPLIGRQRLARGRAEDRREQRAAARSGAPCALRPRWTSGFYYRPDVNRVLFHFRPDDPAASPCCYDTVVSESRIADYIGIARGQMPQKAYYGRYRSFPDSCNWAWTETKPVGSYETYFGVEVFEGALPYAGMKVVPSWSGSMFEALMPALFVPEERWAPRSWGENHPLTVRAQIHHGLVEADYGYWGFSPANVPEGGYTVYGVDGIGSDPAGGPSNNDRTFIDHGWEGCPDRPAHPDPPPSAYTNGVVTPHAAFLALRYAPREARDNLRRLARDFPGLYGRWGFRDSVNVDSGEVSDAYLSLDQGMIMAALSNALSHDLLRRAFADRELERGLRPVIGIEEFGTSP